MLFLTLLLTINVAAQEFTHVDWSTAVHQGTLPKVNQTMDLGAVTNSAAFTVSVDYPVFETLNKQELSLVKKLNVSALTLCSIIGISGFRVKNLSEK